MNPEWQNYQTQLVTECNQISQWLQQEFNKIRTGRATPGLLEGVKVVAYNVGMNLMELANIQIPEARTILVKPYDVSTIKEICKAINKFNDELNPVIDDKVIRIKLPSPTEESRKKSVKLIKEQLEKAKINVRNVRKNLQAKIKAQKYQEGLETIYLEKLEQAIKKANQELDQLFKAKEKELLTI